MCFLTQKKEYKRQKAFTFIELIITIVLVLTLSSLSFQLWFKPNDYLKNDIDNVIYLINTAQRLSHVTDTIVKIDLFNNRLSIFIKPDQTEAFSLYAPTKEKEMISQSFQVTLSSFEPYHLPIFFQSGILISKNLQKINRKEITVNEKNIIIEGLSGVAYVAQ